MESQQSPAEIDAEFLAWLALHLGVVFEETLRPGSVQTHLDAVERVSPSTTTKRSTIKRAISNLEKILRPASDEELIAALVDLERATGRARDAGEDALLDRYVAKLRRYPSDIALHVCETWDERPDPVGTFFPKPAQLNQACEELFATRRRWLPALQRFESGEVYHADAEQEKTDADIAEVRAMRDRVTLQLRHTARDVSNNYVDSVRNRASLILDKARRDAEADAELIERALHPEAFGK